MAKKDKKHSKDHKKAERKAAEKAEAKAAKKAREAEKEARRAAERAEQKAKGKAAEKTSKDKNVAKAKGKADQRKADKKAKNNAAKKPKEAKDKAKRKSAKSTEPMSRAIRFGSGSTLADFDPASTPGFTGDEDDATELMETMQGAISDLQERLYAEGKSGGRRSLLLVIQGMDTSGKGGIMRHVVGSFDPQGVDLTSFKAPTEEERAHPFLWRIRKALPGPGRIGVFDRSHYEDVLIVRVHNFVPRAQWMRRYAQINAFEKSVAASGTTIIKVMLHVSKEEQKARLSERLARPDKHWKFNPGDIDERGHWTAYQEAYEAALTRCSTEVAPWFVVPADNKWFARYAVTKLVLEHLEEIDPQWPQATFDVAEQQARLAASD